MVVSGSAERSGQISACGVNGLPLVLKVDSAGDLCDQNRCEILGPAFFVDTQIIDFGHLDFIAFDTSEDRHTGDAGYELFLFVSDTNEPFRLIAWRREGPSEELFGIIEPKSVIIVLNVVVGQEFIQLIELVIIFDIDLAPEEILIGKCFRFFVDVFDFPEAFDVAVFDLFFIVSEHGSVVPIVVFFEDVLVVLDFSTVFSNQLCKSYPSLV